MPTAPRPDYKELLDMLRAAPAKQGIGAGRYWDWCTKKDALLARVPEP